MGFEAENQPSSHLSNVYFSSAKPFLHASCRQVVDDFAGRLRMICMWVVGGLRMICMWVVDGLRMILSVGNMQLSPTDNLLPESNKKNILPAWFCP